MNKILIICGPTGTGKTALAAKLAKKMNGELISADSRQVFRGRDLETNKQRPNVPIWLYDIVNSEEEFSVSHWVMLARRAIADIQKRGKLPIVVGGTGLYIKALLEPLDTIDIPPDPLLRSQHLSVKELQRMVPRGDMNWSDWNNPRRLVRKLEIGKKRGTKPKKYDALVVGLNAPLHVLYERIDSGIEERLRRGMKEKPTNEHAIARRQLTWFRSQRAIHWFDISKKGFEDAILKLIHEQN